MIKIFTETDLIRYLYRETTEEEKTEIENALIRDSELQTLFNELSETINTIDRTNMEPSSGTVLNILSYSRNWQPKA